MSSPRPSKAQTSASILSEQAKRASTLLKYASDATRIEIMLLLAHGERHIGSLCQELNQSRPAGSHHIALLRFGGLIEPRRQGTTKFYSLTETGERLVEVLRELIA